MKVDVNENIELPERVRDIVKAQPLSPLSPNCRLREPASAKAYEAPQVERPELQEAVLAS